MESVGSYKGADEIYMSGLEATELRLGLPGTPPNSAIKTKRALEEDDELTVDQSLQQQESSESAASPPAPSPAKSQVVGWPPVQSFRRKNNAQHHQQQQATKKASPVEEKQAVSTAAVLLVKVSMDGAPYLRKADLGSYNGYKDLRLAIDAMFRCFSPLSLQYMMTYEDKDGDWMLVGDVPWEMFASSCKRLWIMKSSTTEA